MGLKSAFTQVKWAAHYEGWPFALFRVMVKPAKILGWDGTHSAWFQHLAERRFDKRFGVQTAGTVDVCDLDVSDEVKLHAVEYTPTASFRFGHVISGLDIDYGEYVFVDIGSGKGRAMVMAAEYPFRKIIGVEISKRLHELAVHNISQYRNSRRRCGELTCQCVDALEFEFPPEPLVLYLFNPFSAQILSKLLSRVRATIQEHPRPVVVVYFNPRHLEVFDRFDDFRQISLEGTGPSACAVYASRATATPATHSDEQSRDTCAAAAS